MQCEDVTVVLLFCFGFFAFGLWANKRDACVRAEKRAIALFLCLTRWRIGQKFCVSLFFLIKEKPKSKTINRVRRERKWCLDLSKRMDNGVGAMLPLFVESQIDAIKRKHRSMSCSLVGWRTGSRDERECSMTRMVLREQKLI